MLVMVDGNSVDTQSANMETLSDALNWLQEMLAGKGRIISHIQVDGQVLNGQEITDAANLPIVGKALAFGTADEKELALRMLGKIAALVEYLGTQHQEVAAKLERGQQAQALENLNSVISAWLQVQSSYQRLVAMLQLDLTILPAGESKTGLDVLNEFGAQLKEIIGALKNQDMVLLGDILQYEMDNAIANWNAMLASTLGVVDPSLLASTAE